MFPGYQKLKMPILQTFPELIKNILLLEQFQFEEERFNSACCSLEILAKGFYDWSINRQNMSSFETAKLFRRYLSTFSCFYTAIQPEWECFTLSGTIINRSGSCLGLTTLHIALGEMVGFPMMSALFEGHIVPVYRDGEVPIFIETTRRSSTMYEHSIQQLHGKPIKILSHDEFLAVHLSNRASLIYARVGLMDDAIFLIDSALEIFPDYTAGWINRAAIMKKLENNKEMRRSLDMAKSLKPGIRYTKAIERIEKNHLTKN
jgi:tetratricopeptide (TPR) repeat protein